MTAGTEEYAGAAVQLRHNYAFSSVDDKGSFVGHIRNHSKINILSNGFEIFMLRIRTVELQFCFQRHTVR
ncbi:hypothetical protein SDC9_67090 [bioreactor metagenome]|uniref:Uncharacterized protein n=1 Tax=bioreactor metagenome TaxID=1076179 RepID=A0A644Y3D5_9ZZZZ